jgi:ABC-type uncharacterized transport system permease subunit
LTDTGAELTTPAPGPFDAVLRAILVIVFALLAGAIILAVLGRNPVQFYDDVARRTLLSWDGARDVLVQMAPLLMLAASLIVCFRAGLWNLGIDGQFLLGGVFVAAYAPLSVQAMPYPLAIAALFMLAYAVGVVWVAIPALLRAYGGINELITTLMMTFLAFPASALLIKTIFADPNSPAPQTPSLPAEYKLPPIEGTQVHVGVVVAVMTLLLVHGIMTRTAFGVKLQVLGHNPRAAKHAGLNVPLLTLAALGFSAALAAAGGAIEVLGERGMVRADWHPNYGLMVVPLVFLARFNGIAAIPLVGFLAVMLVGGEAAARSADVSNDVLMIVMALILALAAIADRAYVRVGAKG